MNNDALHIPRGRLLDALKERTEWKRTVLSERDRTCGKDRVPIASYMENLALPELFGFDMNDLFTDPHLALETELRHRIFWLDNSQDDGVPGFDIAATAGMYYDMTLFGADVRHTPGGVPEFLPHPIAQKPDLSLIKPFDFHATGAMPSLIRQYREMCRIAATEYGGRIRIGFPAFGRGPLDIYIQLRGYENFVADTQDRPGFVHAFLRHIVGERARFRRERRAFLGEPPAEPNPTAGIDDDWVNVPFISPAIFREFVLPAYRIIQSNEGPVNHFHTCGPMVPIVADLLREFPALRWLDVSGWNDLEELDRRVAPGIGFAVSFINTLVLSGTPAEQRDTLQRIAARRGRRPLSVCVQAIVRLHDDFAEDLSRMNAFIALARTQLSN
jgi:hypothetical protein